LSIAQQCFCGEFMSQQQRNVRMYSCECEMLHGNKKMPLSMDFFRRAIWLVRSEWQISCCALSQVL